MTKKRVGYTGDSKESKKYGCVYTFCYVGDLPQYEWVIFLRNNYNFDIPAVANAVSKRHREIRQKEFICKSCQKQLKDGKYSDNVQIVIFIMKLIMKTIWHVISPHIIWPRVLYLQITACVHVAINWYTEITMYHLQRIKVQLWQCCCSRSII